MTRPRLGFAGVGWIGRMRMEAVAATDLAELAAVADPDPALRARACELAPGAVQVTGFGELLELGLDAIVIATPSAMHADQALAALERGAAVFCQKPLGRTAAETAAVVHAARRRGLALGVDLSYRATAAVRALRRLVVSGELGHVYSGRFVFHNAYGPDKPWFYDRAAAGGGCVMDLGTHLIDLALWLFGHPAVARVDSRLYCGGRRVAPPLLEVEDFAAIQLEFADGRAAEIACSWKVPAGCDAVIEATVYGDAGGATIRNRDGSFYDFVAEHHRGTSRRVVSQPPDDWGGRALVEWTARLAGGAGFDPESERLIDLAAVIDRVYGAAA
jgi:predicted dehydrogenase